MRYFQHMRRLRFLARSTGSSSDRALAVAAIVDLVIARDSPSAPTSLWFAVPAVAVLILPLFARRRFPFGAPAAYWLLAAALSFVDGLLIPSMESLFPVGLASAFLLGNLRDAGRRGSGCRSSSQASRRSSTTSPATTTAELILLPVDFGIAWAAGFALRVRGEQAEAAEDTCGPGRARARGGRTRRGGGGARADRARAPRHRRATPSA